MSIKVIPAIERYKTDCGDLVCEFANDEVGKFLAEPVKDTEKYQILPLAALSPNPWNALTYLEIDAEPIKVSYQCPYTDHYYYAIIPVAVLSNDLEAKYGEAVRKSHYAPDYVLDHEFHKKMHNNLLGLYELEKLFMGSGYTYSTMINDGSGSRIPLSVPLENGDLLYVWAWEWYNK